MARWAGEVAILILWLSFAILSVAVVFDIRSREIPNALSWGLLGVGLAATLLRLHNIGWLSLAGGVLFGFLAGLGLFRLNAFGGGDVKLIASLGAVMGFKDIIGVLFYVAIFGGILAVVARLRREREFAYAPAIALGLLAFIVRGYFR